MSNTTAWLGSASALAEHFFSHWKNRVDVYGGYLPFQHRNGHTSVTKPPVDKRGQVQLTVETMTRHFEGQHEFDVIGLHSTSPDNTSRFLRIDIDKHKETDEVDPHTNLTAALFWFDKLTSLGFHPLLTDSNGKGGFWVDVLFNEPVHTPVVYSFGQWLIKDFADQGLKELPETFPKQAKIDPEGCGNWCRIPGRHHTRPHYSRIWNGSDWLEGQAAVDVLLSTTGDDVMLIPDEGAASGTNWFQFSPIFTVNDR